MHGGHFSAFGNNYCVKHSNQKDKLSPLITQSTSHSKIHKTMKYRWDWKVVLSYVQRGCCETHTHTAGIITYNTDTIKIP